MKNIYSIVLLTIFSIQFVISQEFEIKRESHQLIESRSVYLNGGLRASMGGKSRMSIKVDLPPNTVQWYYSFSTSKGKSGAKNLGLVLQLSSLLADPTRLSTKVLSEIDVPEGVASADIYLCDRSSIDKFLEKSDLYGDPYYYNMEGTTENTKQAVVAIDDLLSGSVYLGLKNPSSTDGLNISIEVVAITETKIAIPKTESQQKAELYGSLGWTEFEKGNYEKCIEYCDKSIAEYKYGWVQANKGLTQLVLGEESKAIETYVSAIMLIKKQPNSNFVLSEIIKDLDNSIEFCMELPGASEIKQIITLQVQN